MLLHNQLIVSMSFILPSSLGHFWVAASLALLPASLFAQGQSAPVRGTVRATTGGSLEYVSLTLHRATDSVAVKTEFSGAQGAYVLLAPPGRYLVSGALVGYKRTWSGAFELPAEGLTLPALELAATASTTLQGVTVTAAREQFERLSDRTVVNVEGTPISAGNTTLDVLSRAPGVTVGGNDNLALRGKQGLLVLIDGKRVPLIGTELADYLRALPAEQVRSIELITNPPAKYDAQGGAGIIAINLKKDQRLGTNGSVNTSYGRGKYGKFTSGLSLNHRQKNINLFATYSYADRQSFQKLDFSRTFFQDDNQVRSRSIQANDSRGHLQSHTWRAGLDYTLTKNTQLGVAVSGLASRVPSTGENTGLFFDAQSQPTAILYSDIYRNLRTPNQTANVSVRHRFAADSLGTPELSADLDFGHYGTYRTLDLFNYYLLPAGRDNRLLGDQDGQLSIWSGKADYIRPLRHRMRLEAGLKASRVHSDNDVLFTREVDGVRTIDPRTTNQFRYDEDIRAGYVTLSRTRPGLTITAGLRGEQTVVEGRQAIDNQRFSRNYFQLFPNVSLERVLTPQHTLALSFSRRIDRPTYNAQLNPFRSYIDAVSYRSGNPNLWPQTSLVTELTHTFKQKLVTGLSYTRTSRPIVGATLLDAEGLVVATFVNLAAQHYYAFTFTAPTKPTKWLSLYANAEVFYIYFEGQLANGSKPAPARPAAILSGNATATLGSGWTLDLNGNYHTPERYAFERVRSFGQLAAGVQKGLGSHASLRFNVTDIFYTAPLRSTATYVPLQEVFRNRQDSRVATLAFNYRFGNDKVAPSRKRATGVEDEKRRAGAVQ
ncbi:TonB-dependent receptor [Hymenobacter fodinae]|uniref:TonB-dependent receptor n=1 Tax=Hymenobacter fodinae TaxID=2510796 RepID=A0A4Z0P2A0_9BACT|nr:TonB-dependent receptor [Hymenobacter fodinae]TGE04204.1 TonB-dependent receptor [Hymenobacter fodinae]